MRSEQSGIGPPDKSESGWQNRPPLREHLAHPDNNQNNRYDRPEIEQTSGRIIERSIQGRTHIAHLALYPRPGRIIEIEQPYERSAQQFRRKVLGIVIQQHAAGHSAGLSACDTLYLFKLRRYLLHIFAASDELRNVKTDPSLQ